MPSNKKLVQQIIETKRKQAKRKGVRLRLPKPPRPLPPDAPARAYRRALQPFMAHLKAITNKKILPEIEGVLEKAQKKRPNTDAMVADEYSDDIDEIFKAASLDFFEEYTPEEIQNIAERIADKVDSFNETQFNKTFKKVLGVDPIASEEWLKQEMTAFVKENVDLITSIPEDYFSEIEGIVMRGARAGTLTADISADIKERYGVSESRADLIARDQVSKFNGNLSQLRQQEVGISKYTWSTSHDDRVRDSHAEKDGETFSWSDPPADTGHPGEDFQCRCVAIPIFDTEPTDETPAEE